jgi:hypothetical protein
LANKLDPGDGGSDDPVEVGGGGGGSGGGRGGALPSWGDFAPDYLTDNTFVEFAKNPTQFIIGIILQVVAGTIIFAGDQVASAVELLSFGGGPEQIGLAEVIPFMLGIVVEGIATVMSAILGVQVTMQSAFVDLARGSGPLGFIAVVFVGAAVFVGLVWLLLTALTLIPVVGPIAELVRDRLEMFIPGAV